VKVFLSYSSVERPLAERICRLLESEGHEVFFDRDDLVAGDTYGARIREAVEGCRVFVFLVSPDSIDRGYALTELALVEALPTKRRPSIIPVLAAPTDLKALPAILQPLTLLEPRGDLPAEVAAQVNAISPTPEAERVRLLGMPGGDGWTVYVDIADRNVREVLYRVDGAASFVSLGFHDYRNPGTGQRLPITTFTPRGKLGQDHDVDVKYIDGLDREQGPFHLKFNTRAEYVRFTKQVLAQTPMWISFREYPPGTLLVYFSHLISYKNAFAEIRYSIDDESLARRVRFAPDWSRRGIPEFDAEHDETYVELPLSSTFVALQLAFIDGTESEVHRFVIAELDVDGR
jgi:hypothetical protein